MRQGFRHAVRRIPHPVIGVSQLQAGIYRTTANYKNIGPVGRAFLFPRLSAKYCKPAAEPWPRNVTADPNPPSDDRKECGQPDSARQPCPHHNHLSGNVLQRRIHNSGTIPRRSPRYSQVNRALCIIRSLRAFICLGVPVEPDVFTVR